MSTQKKATMDEETKCPVCYEQIGENNAATMNCGHAFHFTCITSNILKGSGDHSMNCPMCRKLIVDEEFAESRCEVIDDSDSDSMPSLEEVDDLWEGTQLWRRDLAVRDVVYLSLPHSNGDSFLNNLGWRLTEEDFARFAVPHEERFLGRIEIKCKVVCVVVDPVEGRAPFLVKPYDNRNLLELQAYQPRQDEVIQIIHLNPGSDFAVDAAANVMENHFRVGEILKRQIHDMPMCEITTFVDDKIKNLGFNEKYNFETVKSMIHKIMIDVIMEHKRNIEDAIDNLDPESDADTLTGRAMPFLRDSINFGFN
jgi:hypothetical protein